MDYDLIVIGGGPAGYVGAIRAAQLGKKVVCVEMERAGGTCLNWGCIPTKALLKSAEIKQLLGHLTDYGMTINGEVAVDFPKVMQRSRGVADQMAKGVEYLFKKNKVDYVVGKAQIQGPADAAIKKVNVTGADGKTEILDIGSDVRRTQSAFSRASSIENLKKNFAITVQENSREYEMRFVPRSAVFRRRMNYLVVKLNKRDFLPRSLEVDGKSGVNSVFAINFTTLNTKLPAETFEVYKPK